jgi:RNA polymerase sigma factor (sigma-70 family)
MGKKQSYADQEVIQLLQHRQEQDDIVRHLYRSYYAMVRQYVVQNNGAETDAEDIFQDVVISFIQSVQANKFRGECSVGTFLYTLARHAWLNDLKKRGRAKLREEKYEKEQPVFAGDVTEHLVLRELRLQVADLLYKLGDACRKILTAFYYEELSMKDILAQSDYENEQVVRNKKYKCLKQLEQMISGNPVLRKQIQSLLHHG